MLKIAYLQSRIISILKLKNTAKKTQKLNKTNKQAKTKNSKCLTVHVYLYQKLNIPYSKVSSYNSTGALRDGWKSKGPQALTVNWVPYPSDSHFRVSCLHFSLHLKSKPWSESPLTGTLILFFIVWKIFIRKKKGGGGSSYSRRNLGLFIP